MADLTDAEIDAAIKRGKAAAAQEPRAITASYDLRTDELIIKLSSGATALIPSRLIEGLAGARAADIAAVAVSPGGHGLHWAALDIDVTVPGLVAEVFGTRSYMAKQAGLSRSKAKATAARENGKKGGRPRKPIEAGSRIAAKRVKV